MTKRSEINPLLAKKITDDFQGWMQRCGQDNPDLSHLSRAEIDEVIRSMYEMRTTGKLIFHYTGTGGIVPELQVKGEAVIKILRKND